MITKENFKKLIKEVNEEREAGLFIFTDDTSKILNDGTEISETMIDKLKFYYPSIKRSQWENFRAALMDREFLKVKKINFGNWPIKLLYETLKNKNFSLIIKIENQYLEFIKNKINYDIIYKDYKRSVEQ